MYYNAKEARDCADFVNKYNIQAIAERITEDASRGAYFSIITAPIFSTKGDKARFDTMLCSRFGFKIIYTDDGDLCISWSNENSSN